MSADPFHSDLELAIRWDMACRYDRAAMGAIFFGPDWIDPAFPAAATAPEEAT